MSNRTIALGAVAALLLLSGFTRDAPLVVHKMMVQVLAPQAQVVWDAASKSLNDDGNPDPAKVSADEWTHIAAAARAMLNSAHELANAKTIVAADKGVKIFNEGVEGGFSAAQVQHFITADPASFRKYAQKLGSVSTDIAAAADKKDVKKLWDSSNDLDQVCEACHGQFWHPQQ